jgi:hypothetical protein
MSYDAKVFNVMIASPGDVASERTIIRDVIYEWNAIHSKTRNIVLLPIGWESHSSPEMGNHPQEIINNKILDKCDLLVGVFWTRIGTRTKDYASGSVEEIEKIIEAKKPVMLYFSSQPAVLRNVDQEQYKELENFRESCSKRGLYHEYDSHTNFRNDFFHHLQLKLNEDLLFKDIQSASIDEVVISNTQLPSLTNEARIILKEASLDPHGNILHVHYIGGTSVEANGKNFISSQERREVARWESALKELVNNDLVMDRGYKGEIFEITNLGYQIADMIQL